MVTIAEEIRGGLNFLITQAEKMDGRVTTHSDHDVFRIGLRNCNCSTKCIEMIYAQMKNWNWFQDVDDGLFDFSHFT